MVKKIRIYVLIAIILITIVIGSILFYNFIYKKEAPSGKIEREKSETEVEGGGEIPAEEEREKRSSNNTNLEGTGAGGGGGSGGAGSGAGGGGGAGGSAETSGGVEYISDKTICQNAQNTNLCDGLDLTYGQGYRTTCCSEHSLCC